MERSPDWRHEMSPGLQMTEVPAGACSGLWLNTLFNGSVPMYQWLCTSWSQHSGRRVRTIAYVVPAWLHSKTLLKQTEAGKKSNASSYWGMEELRPRRWGGSVAWSWTWPIPWMLSQLKAAWKVHLVGSLSNSVPCVFQSRKATEYD